ncbi:hypothetical protein AVEN_10205-1 [Araneus ventricosus]|uniref:THAP-type domain-containing protein n=1 Tax=Araneus ventricosus TaxID=182803 RepID=A0A4Y2RP40_ARAVE|nr:hypothetical protein AVEN_10205-1 [Araneus ventricosus]
MLSSCVIPLCSSKYRKNGPNIKVYNFLKDTELRNRWSLAIKRESLLQQSIARFLQLHFKDSDFLTTSKAVYPKTGNVIEASLKIKR